ncbi:hypothetical protein FXO37_08583 [Capsicum annuum]|nr:hypothetical protein FXO37_08583 [Capsicum annuum]
MNKIIFIASVLDPRNKFEYVSFALEELNGKETRKKFSSKFENKHFEKYDSHEEKSQEIEVVLEVLNRSWINTLVNQEPMPEPGCKSKSKDFDILNWLKVNSPIFPILSLLARDVLAILMSSVASECAFSTGGQWTNGCYCLLDECIWPIEYCLLDIEATGKWMSSDAKLSHGLSVLTDARLSGVENSSTWISLDMSSNEAIALGNEACNSCISHGQSSADMI